MREDCVLIIVAKKNFVAKRCRKKIGREREREINIYRSIYLQIFLSVQITERCNLKAG